MSRVSRTIRKGPLRRVSGKELREALGFRSERSFQRAHQAGLIGMKLYPLPSPGRGVYARSDDLEKYLANHAGPKSPKGRAP